MSLILSTTDNQDDTGMEATVTGSDVGSANTIYYSQVSRGTNPLAWSVAGSLTGDGTVNLPLIAGYYYLYCAGTVSSAPALSPPIIGMASRAVLSMQTQVELAIQAKIQGLTLAPIAPPLPSIPASRVIRFDTPMTDLKLPLVQLPCVIVTPAMIPESVEPIVNARDDIGWPVQVLILALFGGQQQGMGDSIFRWREQIFRAVRYQRLETVPEVYTVRPEPQAVLNWQPPKYEYAFSAITFRAVGRDYRGV